MKEYVGKVKELFVQKQLPCTTGIVVALIFFYLLGKTDIGYNVFAMAPGEILPPLAHIWTPVTAGFLESSFVSLLIDIGTTVIAGATFEAPWGTIKFAKFMAVSSVAACLGAASSFIFLYTVTGNLTYLFFKFSGYAGVVAGILVAFKQDFSERALTIGPISIEYRYGPVGFVLLNILAYYPLGLVPGSNAMLAFHGFLSSWMYLRFYQKRVGSLFWGDSSSNFALADFFPTFLQPIIAVAGNRVFKFLVMINVCSEATVQYDLENPGPLKVTVSDGEKERHKQRALRDLELRVKVQEKNPNPTPTTSTSVSLGDNI